MDKYFIKIDDVMYLTHHIDEKHIIDCDEIDWCGRDAECEACVFNSEREEFKPNAIIEFKSVKMDDIVF